PVPFPFIGNLVALSFYEPGYEAFRIWKEKYGRCFTFWMADRPAVVIADYELMKQALVKEGAAYAGRQDIPLSRIVRANKRVNSPRAGTEITVSSEQLVSCGSSTVGLHCMCSGILEWGRMSCRRGMLMECLLQVLDEVKDFLRKCQQNLGQPLDLRDHIDSAVGSIINSLLFGFRFDETNMEQFYQQKSVLVRAMEMSARPSFILLMMFPSLEVLPFFKAYRKEVTENNRVMFDMLDTQIEIHKKEIDFDSVESTDYVEAYLKEQKRLENEPDNGGFTERKPDEILGPIPFPFIGNLVALSFYEPGYEAFRIWKEKYGRCFTFWMADRPAVVIADYELMKQALGGNYGVIGTTGELWQQHRRFALHVFRDFGMGKDVMQERVRLSHAIK
ncbi:hypothetical protein COOONC_04978, partial [Cooperia oncophora]